MPSRQVYGSPGGNLGGVSASGVGFTLGEVRWSDNGLKKYRLFYNAGGASIPCGAVCARAISGGGPFSVTVSTVTELGITLAVCCNDGALGKTVTTDTYFWGLVYGYPAQLWASNISVGTDIAVCQAANGKVIPATVTTGTHFAYNEGDLASGTSNAATLHTDGVGGRFFVYFEDQPPRVGQKYGRTP